MTRPADPAMYREQKQQGASADATVADTQAAFFDTIAHDMRGPITALKASMQMIERRLRKFPERADEGPELQRMLYQVERINHQVTMFLAAAHLAQQRLEMHPSEHDLIASIERVLQVFRTGMPNRTMLFDTDAQHIVGVWDRVRVEEVFSVLLTNALRFSVSGAVTVRAQHNGQTARVEVSDEGLGVPPDERERIFEQYVVGSNVKNPGLGLGLYIAHELIARQGGRIGMVARPEGGSTFWFELPLAGAPSKPAPVIAPTAYPTQP